MGVFKEHTKRKIWNMAVKTGLLASPEDKPPKNSSAFFKLFVTDT
jgi:hypothetical protein